MPTFIQKLSTHFLAGYPGLFIQSGEEARVDQLLKILASKHSLHIMEWNLGYGWVKFDSKQPLQEYNSQDTNLAHCLPSLLDEELDNKLIVIKGAKAALENNSLAIARLKQLLNRIQRHHPAKAAVVLIGENWTIPTEIENQITILPLLLPSPLEIKQQLNQFCQSKNLSLNSELENRISNTLSGLSQTEINQVLSLISHQYQQLDDDALEKMLHEKEQIIAKTGVLEMVTVNQSLDDIGGLENLKNWLNKRAKIINQLHEAEQFGIKAPKGVLIVGMPGCGKSLTAKVAAKLFQLPLLRLDIGSLLGKYVGESEHNMRRALQLAETVSPCILWVDELEKAFVGMGSNNASEVTSRLMGYFLTWMQEKTSAVFIIATANNISALPPELLRKGRFDETFYVGFPNFEERKQILAIHLKKAGHSSESFDMDALATACRDYSGADIENAINEALVSAFFDDKQLTQAKIINAIKATVSLRESLREQINQYETRFEQLKLESASANQGLSVTDMIKLAKDPNFVSRQRVAANPECPEDLLTTLSEDNELSVKRAVYQNPACPEKLLSIRLNISKDQTDYDQELYDLTCLHNNTPADLLIHHIKLGHLSGSLISKLITIPHCKPEVLTAISETKFLTTLLESLTKIPQWHINNKIKDEMYETGICVTKNESIILLYITNKNCSNTNRIYDQIKSIKTIKTPWITSKIEKEFPPEISSEFNKKNWILLTNNFIYSSDKEQQNIKNIANIDIHETNNTYPTDKAFIVEQRIGLIINNQVFCDFKINTEEGWTHQSVSEFVIFLKTYLRLSN